VECPFPQGIVPAKTRGFVWKRYIHCNTPYPVHVLAALYKLQIKVWDKYILCFRHAVFFQKITKLSFKISVEI